MEEATSTIRVAILGGGLAGIAMLRGLLKYPHIAADVYESHPTFRDEGSAVELPNYAQAALQALDPSLEQCLARAGAIPTETEVRLASGPMAGQAIAVNCSAGDGPHKSIVGRQELLAQLTAGLPPRSLRFNSRVTAIREGHSNGTQNGNGVGGAVLVFADGSQKRYDVVVGADHVQGVSRKHVVGSTAAASEPQPTGFWGLHVTVPVERAWSALGSEFLDRAVAGDGPTQTRWVGDGTFMQHGLLNGGRDVQLVVYARLRGGCSDDDDGESHWIKLFTPEEFGAIFANCEPETCKGIVNLFQSVYTVHIAGFLETRHDSPYAPLRTLLSARGAGRTCLTAGTAYFYSCGGGAMGSALVIEEALVLSTLLGRATGGSPSGQVEAALRAFDTVCQPRAELVTRSGFEVSALLAGSTPGVGLANPATLAAGLERTECALLHRFDLQSHLAAAVGMMDQFLIGG